MASVNKVLILGHTCRDPETRYMASGEAVTNISVATNSSWKDKTTGEKREEVEYHRITFFGKLAEIAGQYLKKGSQVYVEGSLRTRKYMDKDGVEKYATDIRADSMQMLGGKPQGDSAPAPQPTSSEPGENLSRQARNTAKATGRVVPDFSDIHEDIPF